MKLRERKIKEKWENENSQTMLGLKSFNNEVFVQKTIETNINHCKSPSYISF